jgi:predicted Kef-type K+ transport protein
MLGPVTPGFHGNVGAIQQLAELGVILLMFGVGLHFRSATSQVKTSRFPARTQLLTISPCWARAGAVMARSRTAAPGFGMAMSVASTVVLMRAFMDRGWLATITAGRSRLARVRGSRLSRSSCCPSWRRRPVPAASGPRCGPAEVTIFVALMLVVMIA